MKGLVKLALLILLFLIKVSLAKELNENKISEYKLICRPFKIENSRYLGIRSFYLNNKKKVLAVNVDTLETKIFDWDDTLTGNFNIADSRFFKLLNKSVSFNLHNGGLKNGNTESVYLTVDLCPSSKKDPFELEIIKEFIRKGHKHIAFAVSGKWFIKNEKYVNWIKEQITKKNLNVIWINHTFNHFYSKRLPLEKNFLLKDGTDIFYEITEVEKLLIKNNITPSIFIRFPGLIANYNLRRDIAFNYFLIAIGSDAWLAKNQKISPGSIILIHGNKNEPKGIKIFKEILKESLNFGSLLEIQP